MERTAVWVGLLVGLESPSVTVAFQPYQRQFVRPLQTAHGPWRDRKGLIVQLRIGSNSDYNIHLSLSLAYGEIAPIPWFGTETLEEAITFLTQLQSVGANLTLADLSAIVERSPAHYSATRFGLGMAMAQLQGRFPRAAATPQPSEICALLPTGATALEAWPQLWEQGHRTFKWKLGVGELAQELSDLEALRRSLPTPAKLRLDANGGFQLADAQKCLGRCDDLAKQGLPIEFLEQPLLPQEFANLIRLSQTYRTPLALDESVTGLAQLRDCHQRGWQGIFVIKGAIAGDPVALLSYCIQHQLKVVFSSVFETGLARQAVFTMAQALQTQTTHLTNQTSPYSLGFGVSQWLKPDGLDGLNAPTHFHLTGEALWQQLSNC